jgi:hypothetical protein
MSKRVLMKKLLVTFAVIFLILSCENSTNGGSSTPFQGRWYTSDNRSLVFSGNDWKTLDPTNNPMVKGTFDYTTEKITFTDTHDYSWSKQKWEEYEKYKIREYPYIISGNTLEITGLNTFTKK